MSTAPSTRITLRQLCKLNLPAPMLLPSLLPAIRAIVPASHAAFFFVDEAGNMINLYAERMLPPELMARYYERYYRDHAQAFTQSWLRRLAARTPITWRSVTEDEKREDYYADVLAPLDVEHIMYAVLCSNTNGRQPIGQLSLYRSANGAPFDATDAEALRDVLHYLVEALRPVQQGAMTDSVEQTAEEAMAVLDANGNTIYADGSWGRLVRLARGEPIAPSHASDEPRALREFLRGVVLAAASARHTHHIVDSFWGKFAFRHHALADASGTRVTALVVSRLAVAPARLAEGASRLPLSPQQKEVALMIALGQTDAEIASNLGITLNTARFHVKQVFAKLRLHDRNEVAAVLRRA